MDKSRDMRRVPTSRLKPPIVHQYGSERLKKDKTRRLSVVDRVSLNNKDCDMGFGESDCEDELRPTTCISKRIKFPKKHFDECETIDHASVPRKQRSAMKKHNCKSNSPPWPSSRKLSNTVNGVQLVRKDGIKRSKLNMEQGDSAVGPITEDEAEVVETLYALAGMFQVTGQIDETKLDGDALEAKLSVLQKKGSDCSLLHSEVSKEENEPKSAGEAVKVESLNEMSLPTSPNIKQLPGELLDNYLAKGNLQTMSKLSRTEPTTETSSCNSLIVGVPPELKVGTGIKQPEYEKTPKSGRKMALTCRPVTALGRQRELQYNFKYCKNNGSALWPGLSRTARLEAGTQGASLQSSTDKLPAWLGNATCATRPYSSDSVPKTEKGTRVAVDGKKTSWKGCGAHVYISHLIQVLQTTGREDREPMQPTHLMPNEGSKQGALIAADNLYGGKNCLNGLVSNKNLVFAAAEKNPNEVRNAILLHKRLLQDQQQQASTSGLYTSQKETIDFLSLSAGGCGLEANNKTNRAENGLGSLTKFDCPYQQSFAETHPISMPPMHYSSDPFSSHLSAAAAQQLPPYLGSNFCSLPHLGTTVSPKQQQQPQRHWIPTAQIAAEYNLGAACISNWQNKGRESQSPIQYAQDILPPSPSSLEFCGPKYVPILPQQPQFIAINTSFPPAKVKAQQHHLPRGYEGNGGRFLPDRAPPLQLLSS